MSAPIKVKATVMSKERAALHRVLDEILDRRPDLEDQLQILLRRVVDAANDPGMVVAMQLLSAGKQAIDAVGGRSARRP